MVNPWHKYSPQSVLVFQWYHYSPVVQLSICEMLSEWKRKSRSMYMSTNEAAIKYYVHIL